MVILAGGLATRLGALSAKTPKAMIPVCGRPFLEHQIELIRAAGVRDLVLCIGHLGEQIREHFGDGEAHGMRIAYSDEGESLLGTGGALKNAAPVLHDAFAMMWGDSYLLLDYPAIWDSFHERRSTAMMVVYRNEGRGDKSNVWVHEGRVALYDKGTDSPDVKYIDNGLTVMRKSVLERIPEGQPYGIEDVFKELSREGLLDAWETRQRFYEIGSVSGLEELEALLRAREAEGAS